MSLKIEKDVRDGVATMQHGLEAMREGRRELTSDIGTALTGGKSTVGSKGYLAVSNLGCKLELCTRD